MKVVLDEHLSLGNVFEGFVWDIPGFDGRKFHWRAEKISGSFDIKISLPYLKHRYKSASFATIDVTQIKKLILEELNDNTGATGQTFC